MEVNGMEWNGMEWNGATLHGAAQHDMARYGTIFSLWYGIELNGMESAERMTFLLEVSTHLPESVCWFWTTSLPSLSLQLEF